MARTQARPQGFGEQSRAEPRRVLHVVTSLVHAGIEVWLIKVMWATDRACYPMDFLVLTGERGECEDEVRALGSLVMRCPHPRRPWLVARRVREILRTEGPYAVVHRHVHHYSGFLMRLCGAMVYGLLVVLLDVAGLRDRIFAALGKVGRAG
jgi:hypothetical protein